MNVFALPIRFTGERPRGKHGPSPAKRRIAPTTTNGALVAARIVAARDKRICRARKRVSDAFAVMKAIEAARSANNRRCEA